MVSMTLQRDTRVGFRFEVFLEVGRHRSQGLLLAREQAATRILRGRLRRLEVNAMERQPRLECLVYRRRRRRLDRDLCRRLRRESARVGTSCGLGYRTTRQAG